MLIDGLSIPKDGAQLFRGALTSDELNQLEAAVLDLPGGQAGLRLKGISNLSPFLTSGGHVGRCAASVLGSDCRPVRAILFDKTPTTNWALGWHQDRTIVVKKRILVDGFNTWSTKREMLHVEPPFAVLSEMLTVRVHIDPVGANNAPLLIAPGSHKMGRIAESDVREVVRQCGAVACPAEPGDVWVYSTPILHASEAAVLPEHRRVLQVDYAVGALPGGLEWLGI